MGLIPFVKDGLDQSDVSVFESYLPDADVSRSL